MSFSQIEHQSWEFKIFSDLVSVYIFFLVNMVFRKQSRTFKGVLPWVIKNVSKDQRNLFGGVI